MKSTFLAAASLWLGAASAGVHKMKLQKIPLSEQLVCFALSRHVSSSCLLPFAISS
jgi:saccharopepsin